MRIGQILKKHCIIPNIKSRTKRAVIRELLEVLEKAGYVKKTEEAEKVILERESLGATSIGEGVAIPHGKLRDLEYMVCAFGISNDGVNFDAADKNPVHIFFLLLAPENTILPYLSVISRISRLLSNDAFRKKLLELDSKEALYKTIIEEEERIF